MSLDVYLDGWPYEQPCTCECGHHHVKRGKERFYSANITHNLNKMADKAGIYEVLWRPDENRITYASDLIPALTEGLAQLKAYPDYYRKFESDNGWGLYDNFVPWLERYLAACEENPDALVSVSR